MPKKQKKQNTFKKLFPPLNLTYDLYNLTEKKKIIIGGVYTHAHTYVRFMISRLHECAHPPTNILKHLLI